jgi:hypothetical protein
MPDPWLLGFALDERWRQGLRRNIAATPPRNVGSDRCQKIRLFTTAMTAMMVSNHQRDAGCPSRHVRQIASAYAIACRSIDIASFRVRANAASRSPTSPSPRAGGIQPDSVNPRTAPAPTHVSAHRSTSPSLVRPADALAARPSRKSDIHADPSRTAPSVTRRAPKTGISATARTPRASVSASAASPTRSCSSGRAAPRPSICRA